jgi:hypothetical protein
MHEQEGAQPADQRRLHLDAAHLERLVRRSKRARLKQLVAPLEDRGGASPNLPAEPRR